ncbi:MAG: PKD domain-containing protein, partial [Phaeodactylibacter sp.]|nr:PKD domain-containing protein [Phaeodactylibacter sp.]
ADRMQFHISTVRASLLDSPACQDPCFSPINTEFTASGTAVDVGTTVNFTNLSSGATTYEWYIDGILFAGTLNSSYTFNQEGLYTISLLAYNADPNCLGEYELLIDVQCPVVANFQVSSSEVGPGDVVYFTNTSQNATSYDWYLDGVLVSNDYNFDNLFNTLGNFDIQLVAGNGTCLDTSALSIITVSTTGLSQTGLPIWPLTSNVDLSFHAIDWRNLPPDVYSVTSNTGGTSFGGSGAAFDGCGNLSFFVVHNGSSDPDNLFIYAPDGTELLSNSTANGPGLNAVRASQEIQVVRVPELSNEWYVIYNEWSSDIGAPSGNAGYNANRIAYSRVRLEGSVLTVLEKDVILVDNNGSDWTYNDGMAVSRTAYGDVNQHFLYATRRQEFASTLSVDRFLITAAGITFDANTGSVNANYWNLTHAGSHVELSPTEDLLVICNRNQFNNYQDYFIFNTSTFNNTDYQVIEGNELVLVADGTANDLSNVLPYTGVLDNIAYDNNLPLNFLRNFDRK